MIRHNTVDTLDLLPSFEKATTQKIGTATVGALTVIRGDSPPVTVFQGIFLGILIVVLILIDNLIKHLLIQRQVEFALFFTGKQKLWRRLDRKSVV